MLQAEKAKLYDAIKDTLYPEQKTNIISMVENIRGVRFSNGLACIHCGSLSLKRNGKYRSRQCYLCKDCGKTVNDRSDSPLSGTHHPHKWLRYFEMMVENNGKSLPKIAQELEIHVFTAFYWRRKILNATCFIGHNQLRGIVESDKGKKGSIAHHKSRKRDGSAQKRGVSNEQICVGVATQYLDNYLFWLRFLELNRKLEKN